LANNDAGAPLNAFSIFLIESLDHLLLRARENRRPRHPVGGSPKRVVDIVFACLALIVLAPLFLIVAAMIRVVMGGPVIFAHERVGLGGRTFACYKFRTMSADADKILAEHLAANPRAAHEWRTTRKLSDDPRVGCLAGILRKSSIDELPQLFNVLRGDMSLVGPRPIVPAELERYGDHARDYLKARPGLTGIWQTSGRNRLSYGKRVALDCYYSRRWSLRLDLALMAKTIPAVMSFDETS
jgi:exopolysaccharide production protein ExoY